MDVISRKEVLRQIMTEKRGQKQRAEGIANEKRLKIAEKVPLYGDLSGTVSRILMNANREVLANPEKGQEISRQAQEQVRALQKQAEEALAAAGYSKDDLKPKYACEKCRDTGFVGEPIHEYCSCVRTELLQRLYAQANITEETFGHFRLDIFSDEIDDRYKQSQRELMKSYKEYCEAFVHDYPKVRRRNILLFGSTGLGKSFLLNCMIAGLIEKGIPVLRLTSYKMLESMRKAYLGKEDGDFDLLLSAEVLVIDDLGTEPMLENITVEYLFTLMNERRNNRLSTLIATNFSLPELEARYTERVFSRITDKMETRIFPFVGSDVRLRARPLS